MIQSGMGLSVSAIVKIGMLGLLFVLLLAANIGRFLLAMCALGTLAFVCLVHVVSDGRAESLRADLDWGARALLMLVSYLVYSSFFEQRLLRWSHLRYAFTLCWVVIAVNLVLGVAGFGFAQYGESFGTAGFFFAGNELAVAMVTVSVPVLHFLYHRVGVIRYLTGAGLMVTLGMLTLTKTAVGGVMLVALALPAVELLGELLRRGRLRARTLGVLAAGIVAAGVAVTLAWALVNSTGFVGRLDFFFRQGGWTAIILSGRDQLASAAVERWLQTSDAGDFFMGRGVAWLIDTIGAQTESDIVDFTIAFGLPFTGVIYALLALTTWKAWHAFVTDPITRNHAGIVAGYSVLILFISVVAGHVINSGTAALLVGACLSAWRAVGVDVVKGVNLCDTARAWRTL